MFISFISMMHGQTNIKWTVSSTRSRSGILWTR